MDKNLACMLFISYKIIRLEEEKRFKDGCSISGVGWISERDKV